MGRSTLIVIGCLYTLGCGRGSRAHASVADAAPPPAQDAGARVAVAGVQCTPDPKFPGAFEVPEGSAAAEVALRPGVRELLVAADSGHRGAAIAWTIPSGPGRALTLPLDQRVSDDVEG